MVEAKEKIIENYIKKHQNDLYRFAYSYVKNSNDALDVVQDSIYKALKNSKSLKEPKKVKTWLFTIVRNTSFTLLKKRKKEVPLSLVGEKSTKEKVSKTEKIYLREVINTLDIESQELIKLRFYEDLQFKEMAEVLKTNVNTVKTRFYKVMDQVKDNYERSG